jgi:tetratricopeptide (TPR) repeat protein
MRTLVFRTAVFVFIISAAAGVVLAQYKGNPVKKEKLVSVIRSHQLQAREIVKVIEANGVDFQVTPDIEQELVSAGARPQVVAAAKANYRAAVVATTAKPQAPPTAPTGTQLAKPKGEPMSKTEIISLLSNGVADERVRTNVEARGVNFKATANDKQEIRSAGGSVALSNLVEQSYLNQNDGTAQVSSGSTQSVSYDDLINLAVQKIGVADYAAAGQALNKAIELDPSQPRAYQVMGAALLYVGGDLATVEKFMRKAIELGGSAVFRVYHDDDGTFNTVCTGSLYVAKDTVRYESDDNRHTFETSTADIKNAKLQGGFRQAFNNKAYVGSFNIKLSSGDKDSKNYNFAPGSGKQAESMLILRLIDKN